MQSKLTSFTDLMVYAESKATKDLRDQLHSPSAPEPPSLQIFDVFLGVLIFFIVLSAFASDEKNDTNSNSTAEIMVHPISEELLPETIYRVGYNDSVYYLNDQPLELAELSNELKAIANEHSELKDIGIQIIIDLDEQISYQQQLISLCRELGFTNLIF